MKLKFIKITRLSIIISFYALTYSCQNNDTKRNDTKLINEDVKQQVEEEKLPSNDTIILSKKHKTNTIIGNFDGDKLADTAQIVMNITNKKYGLKITFGNKKVDYLGMGNDVAGQGFDDIEWAGIFEIASKGGIYANNVSEEGQILSEEEIDEKDKIKLVNDGIFIHQEESCGGGIIYLKKGKYEWIQQE